MNTFVETPAAAPRKDGVDRILYPGQHSQEMRRKRRAAGSVDIPQTHVAAMRILADDLAVTIPSSFSRSIS